MGEGGIFEIDTERFNAAAYPYKGGIWHWRVYDKTTGMVYAEERRRHGREDTIRDMLYFLKKNYPDVSLPSIFGGKPKALYKRGHRGLRESGGARTSSVGSTCSVAHVPRLPSLIIRFYTAV